MNPDDTTGVNQKQVDDELNSIEEALKKTWDESNEGTNYIQFAKIKIDSQPIKE